MKKFNLIVTAAVAASLAACGESTTEKVANEPVAYCANADGRRIDDKFCKGGSSDGANMVTGMVNGAALMYLMSGSRVPDYGQSSSYATRTPAPGKSYVSPSNATFTTRTVPSSTTRGISGTTGRSFTSAAS